MKTLLLCIVLVVNLIETIVCQSTKQAPYERKRTLSSKQIVIYLWQYFVSLRCSFSYGCLICLVDDLKNIDDYMSKELKSILWRVSRSLLLTTRYFVQPSLDDFRGSCYMTHTRAVLKACS